MQTQKRPPAVTTQDIARASGVSTATVSYVLTGRTGVRISQKTRDRVLETARRLQYRPNGLATALRKGRTNTLGIVAPFSVAGATSFSQLVYGKDLTLALTFSAARAGMGVMVYVDTCEFPLRPEQVTDRRVDGVILSGTYGAQQWIDSVRASNTPFVEIGTAFGEWQVHSDNRQGARLAAQHLLSLGHRKIAYWRGPDSSLSARERAESFTNEVVAAGISPSNCPLVYEAEEIEVLFSQRDRPTALFTYNDKRAIDALHLFRKLAIRVPQDVSLVGFDDDVRASSSIPPLTTIQSPVEQLAAAATDLLLRQIDGESPPLEPIRIPTHLIVRESTALTRD